MFINGLNATSNTVFIGASVSYNVNTNLWTGAIYMQELVNTINGGDETFGLTSVSNSDRATVVAAIGPKLAAFVEEVGFPWVQVGAVGNITDTDYGPHVVLINLGVLTSPFSDASTGLYVQTAVGGTSPYPATAGYDPYTNFAEANAALLELLGNYTAW